MAERWFAVTKPSAELTAIDPAPVQRGDGATWQRFKTPNGKIFAQVIHQSGLPIWFKLVSA